MRGRNQLIAIVMLATALTADRIATAAPVLRPQIVQTARRITDRLSRSFRQVVPAHRITQTRCITNIPVPENRVMENQTTIHPTPPTPHHYRRPPPAL